MTLDLDALEAVALAVPSTEWFDEGALFDFGICDADRSRFVATFDPATVLAMAEVVKAAERWVEVDDDCADPPADVIWDDAKDQVRAALRSLTSTAGGEE